MTGFGGSSGLTRRPRQPGLSPSLGLGLTRAVTRSLIRRRLRLTGSEARRVFSESDFGWSRSWPLAVTGPTDSTFQRSGLGASAGLSLAAAQPAADSEAASSPDTRGESQAVRVTHHHDGPVTRRRLPLAGWSWHDKLERGQAPAASRRAAAVQAQPGFKLPRPSWHASDRVGDPGIAAGGPRRPPGTRAVKAASEPLRALGCQCHRDS
jgi:hypothetical protein